MENIAFRIGNFGRRYCFRGSVVGGCVLPVIHFKAAEQDPKQGILVICQLIFMIVWKLRFICVFCFTGYTEKRRG